MLHSLAHKFSVSDCKLNTYFICDKKINFLILSPSTPRKYSQIFGLKLSRTQRCNTFIIASSTIRFMYRISYHQSVCRKQNNRSYIDCVKSNASAANGNIQNHAGGFASNHIIILYRWTMLYTVSPSL